MLPAGTVGRARSVPSLPALPMRTLRAPGGTPRRPPPPDRRHQWRVPRLEISQPRRTAESAATGQLPSEPLGGDLVGWEVPTNAQLGQVRGVAELVHGLRDRHRRHPEPERLDAAAQSGVGDERRRLGEHRRLRHPTVQLDVGRQRPSSAGSTRSPITRRRPVAAATDARPVRHRWVRPGRAGSHPPHS